MRKQRRLETPEKRKRRLMRETQARRDELAADEIALDQMVTRNIEQYGA